MKTLKCPVCGKIFETSHNNKTYCSGECTVIGTRRVKAERKRRGSHRMCTMCGSNFFTTIPDRETCAICTSILKKAAEKKAARYSYKSIAAHNRANPIKSGWRGQMRIAARPALKKFE